MRTIYKVVLIILLSSSILFAETSARELQTKKHNETRNSNPLKREDPYREDRATGGIYNSSGKIVIENGAHVVVSAGNYQSEGTAGITDAGILKLTGDLINNNTNGNPVSTIGTVVFNGSAQQQISGNSVSFGNVTLSNASGLLLGCAANVAGNLILTSGDLNLNGQTITLGGDAALSESGGRVFGSTGQIQTSRNLSDITSENVAGLGAEITTSANLGSTTIIRCHTAQTGAGGTGIQRYYDITPTNNSTLNATLVFHYNDADISGFTESSLSLWKANSPFTDWTEMGGIVSEENNTITLSDIGSFSRWTATDGDHFLPVILSSFTVSYINSTATLTWSTQSETDNLGWNVYRSDTNELDTAIMINSQLVSGAGTSSEPTNYSYTDEYDLIPETTYWYWLESISTGGDNQYYSPVSLYVPLNNDDPDLPAIPEVFGLYQNYPNPFNPSTTLSFALEEDIKVNLIIYDIKGRIVKTVYSGMTTGGILQTFIWDGADENGKEVGSGMYLYSLKTGNKTSTRKMILLR